MFAFIALCLGSACLVSWALTWAVRALAPRWGLIDQPAARKVHVQPTPLGGGVSIFLGVLLPLLAAQAVVSWLLTAESHPGWLPDSLWVHLPGVKYRAGQLWAILGAGSLLMAMGLLDDRFGLSWRWRLGVQFALAIGLVAGGVRATLFVEHPWLGMIATVFWMVVLINSLNFLDNMDGLAGGIGLITSLMFASLMLSATSEPRWLVAGCLLVLAGSILGFLFHNWPPAKIFMGDAGSTFIGCMLASLTVLGTFYETHLPERHVIFAPLCVLATPLYDFTSVVLIRLSRGKSPFQPDRNHFSHRLTDLGLSRKHAVMTVHLVTICTGLGGLLLYHVDTWAGAGLVLTMEVCLLLVVAILETAGRRRARALERGTSAPGERPSA